MQRQGDNERLVQSLSAFLTRDARPSTSNSACAESDEQGPADVSESEAPPDTDAIAVALEVEQCVEQQNVVQVAFDALHSQLQSEVEDADIIECGADADCELPGI